MFVFRPLLETANCARKRVHGDSMFRDRQPAIYQRKVPYSVYESLMMDVESSRVITFRSIFWFDMFSVDASQIHNIPVHSIPP